MILYPCPFHHPCLPLPNRINVFVYICIFLGFTCYEFERGLVSSFCSLCRQLDNRVGERHYNCSILYASWKGSSLDGIIKCDIFCQQFLLVAFCKHVNFLWSLQTKRKINFIQLKIITILLTDNKYVGCGWGGDYTGHNSTQNK